jgi:hypothetical protein
MNNILTVIVLGVFVVRASNAESIHAREVRQQDRIASGVRSGELTAKEAAALEQREAKLQRELHRDRADGRGLTAAERAKIERRQAQLSRQIYHQKHDNQVR